MRAGNVSRTSEGCAHRSVTLAEPMSPVVLKRTPSFVTPMATVSPMVLRSLLGIVHPLSSLGKTCFQMRRARMCAHLQMRANSEEGIWMVALYSVSGMPSLRCSQSLC